MPAPATKSQIHGEIPYVRDHLDRVVIRFDQPGTEIPVQRQPVGIRDGRQSPEPLTLDKQGFTLARIPSRVVAEDRMALIQENSVPSETMGAVTTKYVEEMVPALRKLTGARDLFPQYGMATVRFSNRAAWRGWMSTSAFAHLDFDRSEIDRQLQATLDITGRKVAPFRRQVLLQTWRVITAPPQDMPLTLCDGRSVGAAEIIPLDFHGPKGSRNEFVRSRACHYRPAHAWYYFPNMTPDEVILFKGFDSDLPDAGNAMHTTFDDTTVADAVPRGSVECRYIALFD
jgi:hypothetical protein